MTCVYNFYFYNSLFHTIYSTLSYLSELYHHFITSAVTPTPQRTFNTPPISTVSQTSMVLSTTPPPPTKPAYRMEFVPRKTPLFPSSTESSSPTWNILKGSSLYHWTMTRMVSKLLSYILVSYVINIQLENNFEVCYRFY